MNLIIYQVNRIHWHQNEQRIVSLKDINEEFWKILGKNTPK